MKTASQMQAFLGNGDQHVSADRDPDLRLDRVLGGSKKRFDPQVLLDPLEEQFDLPALAIQVCNQLGFEREVVGQESDALARIVFGHHPAQRGGVILAGIENRQDAGLIAHDVGVGFVHRVGVAALELGVRFGSGDKEGIGLVNHKQPPEIEVTPVQQLIGTGLDGQLIQSVDLVGLVVGDVNKRGDGAAQVQQSVQFDGGLVRAKRCPRINRQTQIYLRGVESINRCVQVDGQGVLRIQGPRHGDQVLGKVGVDLPRSSGIGMGQGIARDSLATQTHVIQTLGLGAQVDLDVAQGLAVRQLGKGHRQELVHAGEVLDLVIASVGGHASAKSAQRQEGHELRENKLALVHGGPLRAHAKDHKLRLRRSNHDQTEIVKNQDKSLTYDVLM
jgi:hypothetical protein